MEKLALWISIISVSLFNAQNYYGTEIIGELSTNMPQNLTKSADKLLISGFIGNNLTGSFPITFKGGNQDGIVTALSPTTGTIQWIKQFGGGSAESVVDTAIDAAGNIYITGFFSGAGATNGLDADPGSNVYTLSVPSPSANKDIFIIKLNPAGDFVWAKQLSSPSGTADDEVYSIKLDSAGNIILAGGYKYLDFDPGPGTVEMITQSQFSMYSFILKLTSNGDFIWVKTLPSLYSRIHSIALDSSDNIYAVGRYSGTIDLNPDPTVSDIKTCLGTFNAFVAKYSPNGNYVWGASYGGSLADSPNKIILKDNNIFVGGYFGGTVDLDPSSGVNSYTYAGGVHAYISKFTTDGNYITSMVIPGTATNTDTITDMMMDENNNIYVSGSFENIITLGGNNYASYSIIEDAFYLKLDSNLTFSKIYLIQGVNGAQKNSFIQKLDSTKFLAVGSSSAVTDFDFTSSVSPEVTPNAISYIYLTKFDFENTVLDTNDFILDNSTFSIYPNPAEIYIYIKSTKKIRNAAIYSFDGKNLMTISGSDIKNINVSLLPKGVYIVQTVDENGDKNQSKFIKK